MTSASLVTKAKTTECPSCWETVGATSPCKYHQFLTQWSAGQTPQSLGYQGLGSTGRQATETSKQINEETKHTSSHSSQYFPYFAFCRLLAAINQDDKLNLSGFPPRRAAVIDQPCFQLRQEWAGWASVRFATTIEKNPEICYSYLPYYLSFCNSYLKKKTLSFGQHTIHWIPVSTG